ncbi:MAG: hypothetical protein QOF52_2288 [Propionibacteriaceae bacterium]|nr:hypothetical protein [Propionibacteriaceae bacterium]
MRSFTPRSPSAIGHDLYARFYRVIRHIHRTLLGVSRPNRARLEVATGPASRAVMDLLEASLHDAGIGFTRGDGVRELRPRYHFRSSDADLVAAVLLEVEAETGIEMSWKELRKPRRPLSELPAACEVEDEVRTVTNFDLWIAERGSADDEDSKSFSVVQIDFWRESASALRGSQYTEAPRPNDVVTSMRWAEFDRIIGADHGDRLVSLDAADAAPNLYSRNFPIDVVYTWVDDKDAAWRAIKAEYKVDTQGGDGHEGRADLAERFRNRDELKYSMRSIEMFAPFVRKIFIVTMDQVPAWLDTSHPQVEVVSHRDIYSDQSALPTFNSSSIETQLHHIEGLSEHFIYFNDDMFLGRPASWNDFFLANGAPKFFPTGHSISAEVIDDTAEEYLVADRNAIDLFAHHYGFVVHKPMEHVPYPARRSILQDMENQFQAEFDACQRARFRSSKDIRPIAFMAPHYGFFHNRAVPGRLDHRYLALWKPVIDVQLANVLKSRRYKSFCINDAGVDPEREPLVDALVADFLKSYFPHPSSFELPSPPSSQSDGQG